MTITIIGTGLIGGSMALILKNKGFAQKVIGVDTNKEHEQTALQLGIVDKIAPLEEALAESAIVIMAIPVDNSAQMLPALLDKVTQQVVLDVGSTKTCIINSIKGHPRRGRFIATHPMWGTENSGPAAARSNAFAGKASVICNKEESDEDVVQTAEKLYQELGMHLVYMNATDHDIHVAYISHISHITSFALANTVLEKEREEDTIFELASSGFESTVRLAKSSVDMWAPIFIQNKENLLDVLNEHISQLRKFKSCLEKDNFDYLQELIINANKIRRILK